MRSAAQRETHRLREERRRNRVRETNRLLAIAEAERVERQERADEDVVSAVLRKPIMTSEPHVTGRHHYAGVAEEGALLVFTATGQTAPARMIVGPRIEIIDGRPSRVDVLAGLKLTERRKSAGLLLRADWQEVGTGINASAVDYFRSGGGGSGLGGHATILSQIKTRARLDGAMTAAGAFAPLLARVVLDGVPLAVWACQAGRTIQAARGWLEAALDRVAAYFWPDAPRGAVQRIRTIGPARAEYGVTTEEIG